MSDGNLLAAIAFLFTAYSGLGAAVIKYLLGEVRELGEQLRLANEATSASNKTNANMAALVPGLYAEISDLRAQQSEKRP